MFAGHFAAGFAIKRFFPEAPLWTLFLGTQWADVLFMGFITVGLERVTLRLDQVGPLVLGLEWMPWSHSLLMGIVYAAVATGVGWGMGSVRAGFAVGLAIVSHWVCDVMVHTPDVPVGIDGTRLGTSLWLWPVPAFLFELAWVLACAGLLAATLDGELRKRVGIVTGVLLVAQVPMSFAPAHDLPIWVLALGAELAFVAFTALAWWAERPQGTESTG